ncbi:MAG TPA: asparagine synthase-related protein, partial [Sphingomicrobium sp.]|nr:asparagine synthase-related protein [Sphingomicrobium sp.]
MLAALSAFRADGSSMESLGEACFGCHLHHTLPEDSFDRQPYVGGGGRFLLAADARIDNRDELAAALGIGPPDRARLSDCELLLRGWERWGLDLVERLLGDFAIAVWDSRERQLALVRGLLSSRPLFYWHGPGLAAFASSPSALAAIPDTDRRPDIDRIARLVAGDRNGQAGGSLFRGVDSVPHGHAVLIRGGIRSLVRIWVPPESQAAVSVSEAGEALRAELDRAVAAQLRRRDGPVACQLSAGRDSSAVAASAAAAVGNGADRPIALTAAPRADFPAPAIDGWLVDESELAARTAEKVGLTHLVCRPERPDLVELLDRVANLHSQPFGNPVNLPWFAQTCRAAADRGAKVMLMGAAGNFTISAGGIGYLGDYRRQCGLIELLDLAWRLRQADRSIRWRSLAGVAFGSLMPAQWFGRARRLAGRSPAPAANFNLLRPPFRQNVERVANRTGSDARPPGRRRTEQLLEQYEPGDKYTLASWGIDCRDPTADRRVIELCLALPAKALVGSAADRPAYASAFSDRLPIEVVEGRRTGMQAADWYETVAPEALRQAFRRYARHPLVDELFDLAAIELQLDRWPVENGHSEGAYQAYCNQLLRAVAMAGFIDLHF